MLIGKIFSALTFAIILDVHNRTNQNNLHWQWDSLAFEENRVNHTWWLDLKPMND